MAGVPRENRTLELVQAEAAPWRQGAPLEGQGAGDSRARFPRVRDDQMNRWTIVLSILSLILSTFAVGFTCGRMAGNKVYYLNGYRDGLQEAVNTLRADDSN